MSPDFGLFIWNVIAIAVFVLIVLLVVAYFRRKSKRAR